MGSVVIDAVNSFFGQNPTHAHSQQTYCDLPPTRSRNLSTSPNPAKRHRTPSRPAASMSQRTPTASAAHNAQRSDATPSHMHGNSAPAITSL